VVQDFIEGPLRAVDVCAAEGYVQVFGFVNRLGVKPRGTRPAPPVDISKRVGLGVDCDRQLRFYLKKIEVHSLDLEEQLTKV